MKEAYRTLARVCLRLRRYRLWYFCRSPMLPCSACILWLPEALPHVSLLVVLVTDFVRTFFFFFFRSEDDDDLMNTDENVGLGELQSFCWSFLIVSDDELREIASITSPSPLGRSSSSSMSWSCWDVTSDGANSTPSSVRMMISSGATLFTAWTPSSQGLPLDTWSTGSCAGCWAQQQLTLHDAAPTPLICPSI